MSDFAALLGELDLLKAKPAPEADKGDDDADDDAKDPKAAKDDGDGDGDDKLGKAFTVTLADGTTTEAFDGTAMLKALGAQNAALVEQVQELQGGVGRMIAVLKEQHAGRAEDQKLIKALSSKVEKLSAAGTGRRAMLSIAEKPSSAGGGADPAAPNPQMVMAKAMGMARAGTLDWSQIARIEAHQNRGDIGPRDLLAMYPDLLVGA